MKITKGCDEKDEEVRFAGGCSSCGMACVRDGVPGGRWNCSRRELYWWSARDGYGLSHTPPIRMFGTEEAVYGLDWGSLACKAENVYGMQLSVFGGGVEDDLYGLQFGIAGTGWVKDNDLDRCHMNGIQFGTFAAKTAMANGFQLSGVYAEADVVNGLQFAGIYEKANVVNGLQLSGFEAESKKLRGLSVAPLCLSEEVRGIQCGIVNMASAVDGVQIGVYNEACAGRCLQIGVVNCIPGRSLEYLPLLNARLK